MGIYRFDAGFLAHVLRLDAGHMAESRRDFLASVLPRLVRNVKAIAYPFREPPVLSAARDGVAH
jgi:ADP-glucose pyrophosphorylase